MKYSSQWDKRQGLTEGWDVKNGEKIFLLLLISSKPAISPLLEVWGFLAGLQDLGQGEFGFVYEKKEVLS